MKGRVEGVIPDLHSTRASSQSLVGSNLIGEVPLFPVLQQTSPNYSGFSSHSSTVFH